MTGIKNTNKNSLTLKAYGIKTIMVIDIRSAYYKVVKSHVSIPIDSSDNINGKLFCNSCGQTAEIFQEEGDYCID